MPDNPMRLEWSHGRGLAQCDGVSIELRRPPGPLVVELHYTPGIQAEIRERDCDPRRDMTPEEVRQAEAWLRHVTARMREVIGQLYPLEAPQ